MTFSSIMASGLCLLKAENQIAAEQQASENFDEIGLGGDGFEGGNGLGEFGGFEGGLNVGGYDAGYNPGYNNGDYNPGYSNGGYNPGYSNGDYNPGYNNGNDNPGYNNGDYNPGYATGPVQYPNNNAGYVAPAPAPAQAPAAATPTVVAQPIVVSPKQLKKVVDAKNFKRYGDDFIAKLQKQKASKGMNLDEAKVKNTKKDRDAKAFRKMAGHDDALPTFESIRNNM